MNYQQKISELIQTDDVTFNDARFKKRYELASDKEKLLIDSIFIELCGYSLNYIFNNKGEN